MKPEVTEQRQDYWLFGMWILGTLLGAFFVLDAVYPRAIAAGTLIHHVRQQAIYVVLALVAYLAGSCLSPKWIRPVGAVLMLGSLAACLAVLSPSFGVEINGASRWLRLPGGFTVQPSEFLKVGAVLMLAWAFEHLPSRGRRTPSCNHRGSPIFRAVVIGLILLGIVVIELQPDLGTAAVVGGILLAMSWLGGVATWKFMLGVAIAVLAAGVMVHLQPYRLERILHHYERWDSKVSQAIGFQPVRAELGIGMGGLTGQGVGMGLAKYVLPAATTDYVFVTIAEETGLVGSLFTVGLLAGMVGRLLLLGARARNRFAGLLASGLGCWIGMQAITNLAMVTGMIPPIGVPLPFFSMGGSSSVALALGLGLAQRALYVKRREVTEDADRGMRWRDGRTRVPGSPHRVRCSFTGL